ncbi:MAG: hypothetical protein PHU25_08520 [Deltaproteobacteria bacterium]|nr:hypothetical protein [Deltaproteobacteria bacterium]
MVHCLNAPRAAVLLAFCVFSSAEMAKAEAQGWPVPRFTEPPLAPDAGHVVEGTAVAPALSWHASLTAGYAYGLGGAERASRARADISFGLGLPFDLEAAVALPAAITLGAREGSEPGAGSRPFEGMGEDGPAVGDLKAGVLWRALDSSRGGLGLLVGLEATAPTGENGSLMGEGGFTAEPLVSLAGQMLGTRISLNLAYRVRPEHTTIADGRVFEQDDDLVWRAGVRIPVKHDVAWSVEGEGTVGLSTSEGAWPPSQSRPVWLGAGVDLPIGRLHRFGLFAGVGVVGRMSPAFSGGARFTFLPVLPDEDNDGVAGGADECPLIPEDADGFEDSDGCPDLDNDSDGFPDDEDRCPNEPAREGSADGC